MSLTYGELCAGYGGLFEGVRSVLGGDLAWYSEFDPAPSKVMAHHHPGVPNIGDMTKVDWTTVEPVDVLAGGTPCQDLSHAGKRAGMTEGTRSNLWVQMREAVNVLRPRLVVWENVRGALSAEAASDLEPCPGCMGDPGDGRVVLRALGRVVGDLAELGYVGSWYGLRAADVGAAHGRFRVFLFATPADAGGIGGLEAVQHDGRGTQVRDGAGIPHQPDRDALRVGSERDLTLLPTPAVNDMGASYTPETWDAWTAKMQAAHGNGNGHGKSLSIEAQRLLPTPTTTQRGTDANLDTREGARANLHNEVAKLLPTPEAADGSGGRKSAEFGGHRESGAKRSVTLATAVDHRWGDYSQAIARWEHVIGRTAPDPTEPGAKGNPRLSPAFVEWLMGLPAGHVTDTGITRNESLKALGNGVVPQQAAAATRAWLADTYQEARTA